jgi:hypothetical protein
MQMRSIGSQERYDGYTHATRRASDLLNRAKRKQPKPDALLEHALLPLEEHLFRTVEGISSHDLPDMLVELTNDGFTDQTFNIAKTGKTERIVDVLLALVDSLDQENIERDRRTFGDIDFDPYGSPMAYGKYLVKKPLKKCQSCGKGVPIAFHSPQPWDTSNQNNGRFCSTRCYVAQSTSRGRQLLAGT